MRLADARRVIEAAEKKAAEIGHTPMDAEVLPYGRNFAVAGRVAIITGAGQGIGREYARQFAAAGAIPVIAEANATTADAVAAEITAAVTAAFGRIDVLINNAAIFTSLKIGPF